MIRRLPILLSLVAVIAAAGYFLFRAPEPKPPVVAEEPAVVAPPPAPVVPAPAEPVVTAPEPSTPRRRPVPAPAATEIPVEAAPTVATLHITADVPGAQVFVDRQFVGEAPATAPDVKPGSHVIHVSAPGFEGVSTTIDVEPGARDVTMSLREVRLSASTKVVHKHRMGSCTGRLVATPQGLRYETTDKEDAFSVPLTDLETFEVDYMAKTLRIKPAKGKRYDFTDPEGNADHLFVFHRDVDKARGRLKKGDPPAQ